MRVLDEWPRYETLLWYPLGSSRQLRYSLPPMSLIEIACPRCSHHGFIAAARLPGILKCSACGLEHTVRDGGYVVRSYDAERLNGAPTGKPKRPQPGMRRRVPIPGELREPRQEPQATASDCSALK